MVIKKQLPWIAVSISLWITGCSSTHQKPPSIPEEGLTVSQIYHQSTKETKPVPRKVARPVKQAAMKKQVTGKKEPSTFKALPNPSIDLYVFPHVIQIDDEQLIKPGYTTAFYLYKSNQYALKSELYG